MPSARSKAPSVKREIVVKRAHRPNANKMSDGARGRASLGVKVWRSSQKWSVQRSTVRSIAWLGLFTDSPEIFNDCKSKQHILFCVVHRGLEVRCMHCPISDVPEDRKSV